MSDELVLTPSPAIRVKALLERYHWLLALAVVGLGLALRVGGLSGYWLNPDEGIYYRIATESEWSRVQNLIVGNAHPPFFYLMLLFVAAISDHFVWLRIPSLIGGCLAIYGMYLVGRKLAGWPAGLAVALLMATSPGAIQQSEIIRPYAMLLAILAFSMWFLFRFLEGRRPRDLWGYSLLLCIGIGWHYSVLLIAAGLTPLFAGMLLAKKFAGREFLSLVIAHLPATALAVGLFFMHIQSTLLGERMQEAAQLGWLRPFFPDSALQALRSFQGVFFLCFGEVYGGPTMLLFFTGMLCAILTRAWASVTVVLGCFAAALVMACLEQYPLGHSRHSIYLLPFLLMPVAQGIGIPLRKGARWALPWLLFLTLLYVFPAPAGNLSGLSTVKFQRMGEQLSRWDAMLKVRDILEKQRDSQRVIIMDSKTYEVTRPIFRADVRRLRARAGPPRYRHFRWHECWVIVSDAWSMNGGIEGRDEQMSLKALLAAVGQKLPQLELSRDHSALILCAGWSRPLAADLKLLDREQQLGGKLLHGGYTLTGMSLLDLDVPRYLELMN